MHGAIPPLPHMPSGHGAHFEHRDDFTLFLPLPLPYPKIAHFMKKKKLECDIKCTAYDLQLSLRHFLRWQILYEIQG